MRLINTHTLKFKEFIGNQVPLYAILSHTWETDEEVSYYEWTHLSKSTKAKAGFAKILGACHLAREEHLQWLWVDTNCIDKSSSSELTEAINSMFAWYRDAEVCYAYIQDVPSADWDDPDTATLFKCSRWFTRGWTLQELLSPANVVFYARDWSRLGSRSGRLIDYIATITGIEEEYLLGSRPVSQASVSKRMSWVSKRETTRTEDIAYCMLGIFDINMPLLYGEGMKAFDRLQQEIMKVSNDHTIFCWTWDDSVPRSWVSMLAPNHHVFSDSGGFHRTDPPNDMRPYSMTNAGLAIDLIVIHSWTYIFVMLDAVKHDVTSHKRACIPLGRVACTNQFDRLAFPDRPIHLALSASSGVNRPYVIESLRDELPRQPIIVRSLCQTPSDAVRRAATMPLPAAYNVLLLLDPWAPGMFMEEHQAPSLTEQKSKSRPIVELHSYDWAEAGINYWGSTIALRPLYWSGFRIHTAIIRLGSRHHHWNLLIVVRPGSNERDMWFCKILAPRGDVDGDDNDNDDEIYSEFVYEQELKGFLDSKEQDVSHDNKFNEVVGRLSVAVGDILLLSQGCEVRAFYLAGSGPTHGYSSGLFDHVSELSDKTSTRDSSNTGNLF
ncbi:hypothetical protein Hte_002428 [Hypoxylon texense]